jgi:hypothetical protein
MPEEPGVVYAQKAGGCHQEGEQPHQVVAGEAVHLMDPFEDQNRINKDIV